ncbi:unnamed protein product, partial [Rotaria sp. Silwood2]
DFACLFELVGRIPNATVQLKKIFENNFRPKGIESIERISATAIDDPELYVKTILEIHEDLSNVAQKFFHNNEHLIDSFNKACGNFINNNAVTKAADNKRKSAELSARYCDILLRKGIEAVVETDLEEKFNQIMVVFNYLEDKDVFRKFYEKMLAKRLVGQLSASDEYEESMISKLKEVCGFEYTSKLQRMFQDIGVSKDLIDPYRKYCEENKLDDIVDFSVMVFSSNSWPFAAPSNFVLPIELKKPFDSFTKFYTQQKHTGRKLTLVHQHSKGDLQTLYTKPKYILHVSTYQMVVLLLFNKSSSWTVERMKDETQIEDALLLQVLCGLLKSKLITCAEINVDEFDKDFKETDIKMNYNINIAEDFKSKKTKINLNVPLKLIKQKDIEDLHRTIDEDRIIVIQAAIIRIMKARQTLKHALLMQEVIQQLSSRFKPEIRVIKKCIDILIEKEYLERQSNEKDVLRYLA